MALPDGASHANGICHQLKLKNEKETTGKDKDKVKKTRNQGFILRDPHIFRRVLGSNHRMIGS